MPDQLPEREMVRCEACGEYHYKDECEIVVIRIIKGKNCALKPLTTQRPVAREVERAPVSEQVKEEERPVVTEAKPAVRKNIIPAHIVSTMIPPGDAGFDQFGAKERRTV